MGFHVCMERRVGAGIILQDSEGRLLLQKRVDDGKWSIPGGWMEEGETPERAAIRETKEETGLDIALMQLLDVHVREDGSVHLLFEAQLLSGKPRTSNENTEIRYIAYDDVEQWHHDQGECVARALARLG